MRVTYFTLQMSAWTSIMLLCFPGWSVCEGSSGAGALDFPPRSLVSAAIGGRKMLQLGALDIATAKIVGVATSTPKTVPSDQVDCPSVDACANTCPVGQIRQCKVRDRKYDLCPCCYECLSSITQAVGPPVDPVKEKPVEKVSGSSADEISDLTKTDNSETTTSFVKSAGVLSSLLASSLHYTGGV
eukprot:jgi/Botrbrau1/8474/Bobra.0237s0090.1